MIAPTVPRAPSTPRGSLVRRAQAWLLERRRRAVERHIAYLAQHRDDVDRTLGYLYRERSMLSVARIELDRLP